MVRLDHIAISVSDWTVSRDFYRDHFGFAVEFEIAAAKTAALSDDADLTLFVTEDGAASTAGPGLAFTLQVDDVDTKYDALFKAGVTIVHEPKKMFWGYGAEVLDPDGYRLRLWDPASMKAKG